MSETKGHEPGVAELSLPSTRWLLLAIVLFAEYLLMSFLFDAEQLVPQEGWASRLRLLGNVGPVVIAIGTATLVLRFQKLQDEVSQIRAELQDPRPVAVLGGIHAGSYVTFLFFSTRVAEADGAALPWHEMIVWLGSALVVGVSIVLLAFPLKVLLSILKRTWPALLLGISVGVSAWLAGLASSSLWHSMARLTFVCAQSLLEPIAGGVITEPEYLIMEVESFRIVVAPECSGYEGIGMATVFVIVFLWSSRETLRFPNALLLIPIAILFAWGLNIVRIVALMMVGARISMDVAVGGFHSKAGWVLFCGFSLLLVALSRRIGFFVKEKPTYARDSWNPVGAHLVPLLTVTALALATGLLSRSNFDNLYGVRVIGGFVALLAYRRYFLLGRWSWSWLAAGIGVVVYAVWIVLQPAANEQATEANLAELNMLTAAGYASWIGFRLFGSIIIVPIVEELAFRGYLLRRLIAPNFEAVSPKHMTLVAVLLSSFAFGVLHQAWLAGTIAGILFALAQHRRGQIGDAILAHAVANALVAFHAMILGEWSLWL